MKVWPVSLAENVAHLLGNQAVNVVHILCSIYSVLRDKPHRGYTATNADPGNASNPCLTSTLSVTATSSMTSSVIQVGTRSLAGQITIVKTQITVQSIAPVGNITLNRPSVDQLTVAWAPPTTGGVPTSCNVSINDSSSTVVIQENGSSLYTYTFTGLTSDTLYTVSVVAINCAGTSNVTSMSKLTLADPPKSASINVVFVANKTLSHLEITWTPVVGCVACYLPPGGQCDHVHIYVPATSYTIFVASINGDGAVGPESNATIYDQAAIAVGVVIPIIVIIVIIISAIVVMVLKKEEFYN